MKKAQERIHAHWKEFIISKSCSNCWYNTRDLSKKRTAFCPQCGAIMDEPPEDVMIRWDKILSKSEAAPVRGR